MSAILPPLFIQVVLTLALLLMLAALRVTESITNPEVARGVRAGRSDMYGRTAMLVADNFRNQFELPVLFYVAVVIAVVTAPVSDLIITLAWVFAISRIVHSAIHCTFNIVLLRFLAFAVGLGALGGMWWLLFQKLLAA